jgi:hypothetical protein
MVETESVRRHLLRVLREDRFEGAALLGQRLAQQGFRLFAIELATERAGAQILQALDDSVHHLVAGPSHHFGLQVERGIVDSCLELLKGNVAVHELPSWRDQEYGTEAYAIRTAE